MKSSKPATAETAPIYECQAKVGGNLDVDMRNSE